MYVYSRIFGNAGVFNYVYVSNTVVVRGMYEVCVSLILCVSNTVVVRGMYEVRVSLILCVSNTVVVRGMYEVRVSLILCVSNTVVVRGMYEVRVSLILYVSNQGLTTGGAGGCGLGVVNVHIKAFHANLNTHQRISINLSRVATLLKRLWGKHC